MLSHEHIHVYPRNLALISERPDGGETRHPRARRALAPEPGGPGARADNCERGALQAQAAAAILSGARAGDYFPAACGTRRTCDLQAIRLAFWRQPLSHRGPLDTHALLWWVIDAPQLSSRARRIITDSSNEVYFSAASGWEIAIKARLGRLSVVATTLSALLWNKWRPTAFRSCPYT